MDDQFLDDMPFTCRACGVVSTGYADFEDGQPPPKPGDLSICFRCGELSIITDNGLTGFPAEHPIHDDPAIVKAVTTIRNHWNEES